MPIIKSVCITILTSVLVSGCGGGGGSSSGNVPPSNTKVAIAESNKTQVAAAVLQSNIRSLSAFGENPIGVTSVNVSSRTNLDIVEITKSTFEMTAGASQNHTIELPSAIVKQGSISCGEETAQSGSIAIDFNDVGDDGEYSPGDSVLFTFNDCLDTENATITQGNLKFVFRSVEGQPAKQITPWKIVANLTYSGLQVRKSNQTILSIEGTLLWSQNQKNADENSISISEALLTVNVPGRDISITDCTFAFDENTKTGELRQFGRQTISSRQLGGVIVAEIVEAQALLGTHGSAPISGVIHVSGEKSLLVLSATGNGGVKIELDSNSDGVIESVESKDWATLASI